MSGASAVLMAAGDRAPDAMDWANISGTSPAANADKTLAGITKPITLRATLGSGVYGAGAKSFLVYKNGSSAGSVTPSDGATLDVSVLLGNTVHYEATKGAPGSATNWSATATITVLETGVTVDTFTISVDAAP